jgi:gas vesicle protein
MGIYKLIEQKKREQKKKENIKIAKIATLTATIGATIGAATGILFAPKAGKETRAELADKTAEAKEKISVKGLELKENISLKVEDSKKDIKAAKEKISEYLAGKKNNEKIETKSEAEVSNDEEAETDAE